MPIRTGGYDIDVTIIVRADVSFIGSPCRYEYLRYDYSYEYGWLRCDTVTDTDVRVKYWPRHLVVCAAPEHIDGILARLGELGDAHRLTITHAPLMPYMEYDSVSSIHRLFIAMRAMELGPDATSVYALTLDLLDANRRCPR